METTPEALDPSRLLSLLQQEIDLYGDGPELSVGPGAGRDAERIA